MTLAPGSRLGPYDIRSLLGTGGMGEVYRARDTRLNRDVAIKVLPAAFISDAERMARFEREAQLVASLNHPHIAWIYGFEEKDGVRALVMELVDGPTLAARISSGPISIEDALPIALQISEALEFAHEKGIIHRDLKPANVKLTADGAVKVLDFGLAKALDPSSTVLADPANSPTFAPGTMIGVVLGTAAYMSPEQAKGKTVDRRTDIWSFGCLLFEMLTGKQAFGGETITDTLAAVVRAEPQWELLPGNTPLPLRTLLKRCLQKDPKERLRDIGDARIELRQLLSASSLPIVAPASDLLVSRRSTVRGWRWVLAIVAFAAAVAAWLLFNTRPGVPAPVTRFALTLPNMDGFGEIAISPDGSAIVFDTLPRGANNEGSQFYLRRLDQLGATPIPGTKESSFPSFSPDGKWLSFGSTTTLSKVRLDSGTVQTLGAVSGLIGATWVDENTIVISQFGRGLFRVSPNGGTPELITAAGSETNGRNYVAVTRLPGGKFVLASLTSAGSISEATQDIAIIRVDQPSGIARPKIVLQGAKLARYAAPGFLLFTRGESLFAVRFDLNQQNVIGTPLLVADKFKVVLDQPLLTFDASANGVLAYSSPVGQQRVPVMLDRKGKEQPLNIEPRRCWDPQLSPDGKLLAVAIESDAQHQNIWVFDLQRHTWIRLGFDQRQEMAPVWSPDSRRLFYITDAQELFCKVADGSSPEQLVLKFADGRIRFFTSITPDGKTLIGEETGQTFQWDVITLHLKADGVHADGNVAPLVATPATELRPQLSPDGHWLAYVSVESGKAEIYVRSYPGQGGKWQVSNGGGDEPRWSGNSRELFYVSGDAVMAVNVKTAPTFTSDKPRLLFQGKYVRPGGVLNYVVTPDGQKFIMLKQAESTPPEVDVVMNWASELQK